MVNGGAYNFAVGQIAMHKCQEDDVNPIKLCIVQQFHPTEGPMAGFNMYRISYIYEGAVHEALLPERALMAYRSVQ